MVFVGTQIPDTPFWETVVAFDIPTDFFRPRLAVPSLTPMIFDACVARGPERHSVKGKDESWQKMSYAGRTVRTYPMSPGCHRWLWNGMDQNIAGQW